MTYEQLLPVYRQITGLPGQDDAFNRWVQGIIDASGSRAGVEGIPDNFFQTPTGQQYVGKTTTTGSTPPAAAPTAPTTPSAPSTPPDLGASLQAYFNSEPAFQAEYSRVAGQGDQRSAVEWMYDHIAASPQDKQKFTTLVNSGAINTAIPAGQEVSGDVPVEQALFDLIFPSLQSDIAGDAERRALADTLAKQAAADYNLARDALSPEENARRLAEEYAMADTTSGRISASAGTAASEQLAALQASIAAMQQNLSGDLAARAAALQEQIAALNSNLSTLDASQKAALAEQIAANQRNLEDSVAAQRQSLAQELATLQGGVDARSAARAAALQQELASLQNVNTAQANARKAALQQEITSLRGAATAENQARRAALETEIAGLTAAQAPLAQARLDTANALTTAVNLGREAATDQLTAQRAKQGYLGSSTFDRANLARATIGAGQQAAQAMGSARELNAADIRSIQARAATEGRGIDDVLAGRNLDIAGREATEGRTLADWIAGNEATLGTRAATGTSAIANEAADARFDITARGATGNRTLADILAEGTRGIGDTGAAGNAAINNATATGRFNIGNTGATQTYQDKTMGSTQLRSLLDELAKGKATIGGNLALQQQTARDTGAKAKQGYFDNAYTRGQGALLSRPGLSTNLASTLTSLGNYGSTGTNRALGTLNWWNTNSGAAPTPGYTPAQASTSGNDIAGLGASLLGSALNYGNANNWWKNAKTGEDYTNSANDD